MSDIDLDVFVTDVDSGAPIPGAVVLAYGPMVPAQFNSRYSQGDGGCNFYHGAPTVQAPYSFTVIAAGYQPWTTTDQPIQFGPNSVNVLAKLKSFRKPLRVPTREQVCLGQTTQQGLRITTEQFGEMPWWGACWAWLTPSDRAMAAKQLLAHGDTICLIQVALDGRALYDEPNQFYSPENFPPLTQTLAQTVALCREAMDLGFKAVWLFLDGDNGNYGYPVAIQQTNELGPLLGELNKCVLQLPGWDGVFYGYEPVSKISDFAAQARAAGALYVGLEHNSGHIPLGEGPTDFTPEGRMAGFDMVLGEVNGTTHDDTTWQILARMAQPYVRPPDQPPHDDPPPVSNYLAAPSPRGPFYYRIFEYLIYQYVRGMSDADVATEKAYLQACSPEQVIC